MAADPHNIVRLILPRRDRAAGGDAYRDAARTLRQWRADRLLIPDRQPALYVYEQAAAGRAGSVGAAPVKVLQRGLIGALCLSPPGAGVVWPHEDIAPGPVADRMALMEATQANLEPIFLLHDGERGASARIIEAAAFARQPLIDAVTGDRIRHRLWAVTDPAELSAITEDLSPRRALIADGHHRYAAYLELQRRQRAAGGGPGPWDYGLALLVDVSGYPPDVGAIHRVLPRLAPAAAAEMAKAACTVRKLPVRTRRLRAALDELADAAGRGPAFLVAGGGEVSLLTDPDPLQLDAAMPPGRSPAWRALAASVLQELLIGRVWRIADGSTDVQIVHNDAAEAVRMADETGGTAVICCPMSIREASAVAARGERVPWKSTSFGPKPRTGLVIRTFADG